jgi:hypothetical protein
MKPLRDSLFPATFLLTQLLSACALGAAGPDTEVAPTAEHAAPAPADIVQGFYAAVNAGDLEAALLLVSDDAQCRGHCYLDGKAAFRPFVQATIEDGSRFVLSNLRVSGELVGFDYLLYQGGRVSARGVDCEMRVVDGRITHYEIR